MQLTRSHVATSLASGSRRPSLRCVVPCAPGRCFAKNVAAQEGASLELATKEKSMSSAVAGGLQAELNKVENATGTIGSYARVDFDPSCETALNEQINIEYNASYVYHALFAHFNSDTVGLPGFAEFFRNSSLEERSHAELLMKYQNERGGKVNLRGITLPELKLNSSATGDALYALEISLALEKLNFLKLRELHETAEKAGDAAMAGFVEGTMLGEQSEDVKAASDRVARLRRINGDGTGTYLFDKEMADAAAGILASANENMA